LSELHLLLLGLAAGAGLGLIVLAGASGFVPFARARRAALAALLGGAIGFALTALLLGPFYHDAKDLAGLAEPFGFAALVAAAGAGLSAAMILRAGR
jgi:hypothetical protein